MSEETDLPPRRRRPPLSIALWLPAIVGLTVAVLLGAFTSLGMAAASLPAFTGRVADEAGIVRVDAAGDVAAQRAMIL